MCTSFKKEILQGVHNLSLSGGNTFKMALYTDAATLNASTTAYTSSNEVSGTGYSAPGQNLTNVDPLTSGTTAYAEYGDITWSTSTTQTRTTRGPGPLRGRRSRPKIYPRSWTSISRWLFPGQGTRTSHLHQCRTISRPRTASGSQLEELV